MQWLALFKLITLILILILMGVIGINVKNLAFHLTQARHGHEGRVGARSGRLGEQER